MRILIYGDSISEGLWDYKKGGWANRLKLDFYKKYSYEKMVFNFGISAYTSTHINNCFTAFFKSVCKRQENKHKDSVVIIMIGINDCSKSISNGEHQVNPIDFRKNLDKIALKIKKEELIQDVLFVSNININEKKTNKNAEEHYHYNHDIEIYNGLIQDFCAKKGFHFLDIYGKMAKKHMQIDGLHPNTSGHKKIYKYIKKYLVKNII